MRSQLKSWLKPQASIRLFSSASSALKPDQPSANLCSLDPAHWQLSTLANGIRLVHPEPSHTRSRCPSVTLSWRAGARHERYDAGEAGMAHLMQRHVGLSCRSSSGLHLTRSLQQAGAQLSCRGDRENLNFRLVLSDESRLHDCVGLLNQITTQPAFYHWEFYDSAFKLMLRDLNYLHTRDLNLKLTELLHKAAFRNQGLGNSLFVSPHRLSVYEAPEKLHAYHHGPAVPSSDLVELSGFSEEVCLQWLHNNMVPHRLLVLCSGLTAASLSSLRARLESGEVFSVQPASNHQSAPPPTNNTKPERFYSGDERLEKPRSPVSSVALAWPIDPGKDWALCRLLVAAVCGQQPTGVHLYGHDDQGLLGAQLATNQSRGQSEALACSGFNYNYGGGVGLMGVQLATSQDGQHLNSGLRHLKSVVAGLQTQDLSQAALNRAKNIAVADLLLELESDVGVADFLADHLLHQSHLTGVDEMIAAINGLSVADVRSGAKRLLGVNNKPALAALGDVYNVSFVDEI